MEGSMLKIARKSFNFESFHLYVQCGGQPTNRLGCHHVHVMGYHYGHILQQFTAD